MEQGFSVGASVFRDLVSGVVLGADAVWALWYEGAGNWVSPRNVLRRILEHRFLGSWALCLERAYFMIQAVHE